MKSPHRPHTAHALVERHLPSPHLAPIAAAALDPATGSLAVVGSDGLVSVSAPDQRGGYAPPDLIFHPLGEVSGALAIVKGGTLLAVGDDNGSVGVYQRKGGTPIFQEFREGPQGRARRMLGAALSPDGNILATLAVDGIIRIWDIVNRQRIASFGGFAGDTISFDRMGERLLAVDEEGEVALLDLTTRSLLGLAKLRRPAHTARFTPDGTQIIAVGEAGVAVLRSSDGAMTASFSAGGGGGLLDMAISPCGGKLAVTTGRSVHTFALPELNHTGSSRHGAAGTRGVTIWDQGGVKVGGGDGYLITADYRSRLLPGVTALHCFGEHVAAAQGEKIALWRGGERKALLELSPTPTNVAISRSGDLVATSGPGQELALFKGDRTTPIFRGGPDSVGAKQVMVGGSIVAALFANGGVRWWDLDARKVTSLSWPVHAALSGSGAWIALVSKEGVIRVFKTADGEPVGEHPKPMADAPVRLLSFVNRRPELLALDGDGVLALYSLADSSKGGVAPAAEELLQLNCPVDRIWGVRGGRYAGLRLPEGESCSIITVDLSRQQVVAEVANLPACAVVNPDSGNILTPTIAGGLLELSRDGEELRVQRSLALDEWTTFDESGIEFASGGPFGAAS